MVRGQSWFFTTQSRLFIASLACPHTCARVYISVHGVCRGVYIRVRYYIGIHGVCRGPRCVQGSVCMQRSVLCAGFHGVFRCLWCVQVSKVYEDMPMWMYRNVLGLVCRAALGVYSSTSATCRYNPGTHGDSHHGVWAVLTCTA